MYKKLVLLVVSFAIAGCGPVVKVDEEDIVKRSITISTDACIRINLDEDYYITSIEGLNSKGKEIVSTLPDDKNISPILKQIFEEDLKECNVDDNQIINVLINEDNISNGVDYPNMIRGISEEYQIDVFPVNTITEQDRKKAFENDTCYLDEAYIREQLNKNPNFTEEEIRDLNPAEMKDTVEKGLYCEDKTYTLEGDFCVKKIDEMEPKVGNVCEEGYFKYSKKCYKTTPIIDTDKYKCNEPSEELRGNMCYLHEETPADYIYGCKTGVTARKKSEVYPGTKSNPDKYYCVTKENAQKPISRCFKQKNHIVIDGECYVGPAPLLGGGCPSPDIKRGNGCYSPDQKKEFVCPDGTWYDTKHGEIPELCPDTFTYKEPDVLGYTCYDENRKLEENKCILDREIPAIRVRTCEEGSKLIDDKVCINENDYKSLSQGNYCDYDNSKLVDGKCFIYDIIEAKRK